MTREECFYLLCSVIADMGRSFTLQVEHEKNFPGEYMLTVFAWKGEQHSVALFSISTVNKDSFRDRLIHYLRNNGITLTQSLLK